jgi:hypothetical protein
VSDKAAINGLSAAAGSDCGRPPEVRQLLSEIAMLRSELQRMSAQIERQKTDIVALEKERLRLSNSASLRLAVLGAAVTGVPRSLRQRVKHLTLAVARGLVRQPKARAVLRRVFNAVRTP